MMFLTPGTTVQTMTTATPSTQSCHTSKNGMKDNFYNQSIFFRISSQQTTIGGGVLLTILSLQKWIFQ